MEKADLIARLDDLEVQLVHCQVEALKSFEDGYGECLNRVGGVGFDVRGHSFECYIGELQGKAEVRKTGSSEHPDKV